VRVRHLAAVGTALALLGLACSACRREEAPAAPAFTVRLLTSAPGSGRWERAAERGLGRLAAELGADVARLRASSESERRGLIDELGRAHVDLVFCVGADFGRIVYTQAPAYPQTRFVLLPGEERGANLAGIQFLSQGAGYVTGVVAGRLSSTPVIGVIRGAGGSWLEDLEGGFLQGFESVHRNAEPVVVAGPAGPGRLAEQGAQLALLAGDEVDEQVLQAAQKAGIRLLAVDADLMARRPELVMATMDVDVPEAMVRVAREALDGTFAGRTYTFDLASGVLDVTLSPSLEASRRPEIREALEVARSEVTAGIIEIESYGM